MVRYPGGVTLKPKPGLSAHTVSTHLRHVYDKLQATTNNAVAKALREGII